MSECTNCCNPICATQLTVKCGSCNKNIHAKCLNLPQNVMFTIIHLKSASIKINCKQCASAETKIEKLKDLITEIKEDLTARVRALEEAVGKTYPEKIKEEIITECVDYFEGEIETTSYCSETIQHDNQDYKEERINIHSDGTNIAFDNFNQKKCNDSSDNHGERESSPQKPYRQNSFSQNNTEQLYYGREHNGKMSSVSQFGLNKQNNESDINNKEASTSQVRENSESNEKTSRDWWQENNVNTSQRFLFERKQSYEYSQISVNKVSNMSEVSKDWNKGEKRDLSPQNSYQQRTLSHTDNNKISRDFWVADNFKTSQQTQFEDDIMHISKKCKKSENVCDPIRAKGSSSSGLSSQHNSNEMDSELLDWNQEHEERSAMNSEYQKYQSDYKFKKIYFKKLKPRHWCNLPNSCAEVCYVSEDFYFQSPMSPKLDIAYCIGRLLNYHNLEGSCEVLKGVSNHIFCLIVKKLPTSKCRHDIVFRSLQLLREQALLLQIKTLMFPQMENMKGDSFNWSEVPYMIEFLFEKVPFEVFSVPNHKIKEKYIDYIRKTNEVKLTHFKHPLFQMKIKSFIFYWVSEDGYITQEMRGLDRKFKFLTHFQKSVKKMGSIIRYKPDEDYVLYGCVIRKTPLHAIDFDALQKCVVFVNYNNEELFRSAAAPAVEDEDEATNHKIINILRNCLKRVFIHFCWTGDLKEKMPLNRH